MKIYINGQLIRTATGVVNCNSFEYNVPVLSNSNANRYVEDLRIYDHCLNYKEVREISRGLMLYYPFREEATGTLVDCSGYKNHATFLSGSLTIDNETPRNRASGVLDGATYARTGNLKIPTNHTISL